MTTQSQTHPSSLFLSTSPTGDETDFIRLIEAISKSKTPVPKKSQFIFEYTKEAAIHNTLVLAKYDFDLGKALEAQGFSEVSAGSELRPVYQLEALFRYHPNLQSILEVASRGVDYKAPDLPEEKRLEILRSRLEKGNQKSALTKDAIPIVTRLMKKDVVNAYSIIVLPSCLERLKDCELYAMGLQHQMTIDENGNSVPKKRLTHNLSEDKKSGVSINQRVKKEDLPPTVYGYTMLRVLHLIHHIRFNFPEERILLKKVDIEAAYRRLHTIASVAAKCCAQYYLTHLDDDGNHILLDENKIATNRVTGGFSFISEATFDLTDELIKCKLWDPTIDPPPLAELVPEPERLDDSQPFGIALETDVKFPKIVTCGCDGYLDDSITVTKDGEDDKEQVDRAKTADLKALHLTFRPNEGDNEPVPRPPVASVRKLKAEGTLREIIVFLGWFINTRKFIICLPNEKATSWIRSIVELMNKDKADYDELATTVGRLNHVAFVIPSARHFLNRIRLAQDRADKATFAPITKEVKEDLKLWLDFINNARAGISINRIVFRKPTSIVLTDASELGIGGYCLQSNRLWRLKFTPEEARAFSLNMKEYLGAAIGAWLALEDDASTCPCILSLSDSSSTVSWLHSSNHNPNSSPCHNELARMHARKMMLANACDYSQHIKGCENHIPDSLSRDFHLSNQQLLSLFKSTCPHLLPDNPQIMALPPQITSKIASLAQLSPKPRELNCQPKPSTIALGVSGWTSAGKEKLPTPIWKTSPPSIGPVSYAPSWTKFGTGSSLSNLPLREPPRNRPQTSGYDHPLKW